jgi:hypothetical protein
MRRFGFALPAVALITLLAAAPVALAQDGGGNPPPTGWTFSMTIDKTANLMNQGILLHVTGTYTCTDPVDSLGNDSPYGSPVALNRSGGNVNVTEIVKNYVVSGGMGLDGNSFVCDGTTQIWSADLNGNKGDNSPALWKTGGKAFAQAGANICDSKDNCAGTQVQAVITIKH